MKRTLRRVAGMLAALALVAGLSVTMNAAPAQAQVDPEQGTSLPLKAGRFRDVPGSYDFYGEVEWLASMGITTGWADGTFRPHESINRDAFAAFIYRMAGSPRYTPPARSPFKDVPTTRMFYKEITWLASNGITKGWSDGTFRPSQPIGRDAIAAFLYRYACEPQYTPTKSFIDTQRSEHKRAIDWMATKGVSTGWPDGTFRPGLNTERGAMAAFLYRFHMLTGKTLKPTCEKESAAVAQNILLIGSDSRISDAKKAPGWTRTSASNPNGERSDTMMLLQISADRKHVSAISIPRNLAWYIPSGDVMGRAGKVFPINMSYEGGGPEATVRAVESLMGVKIHHWLLTDFSQFESIVNKTASDPNSKNPGKISVRSVLPTYDGNDRIVLPGGNIWLEPNGSQALYYVRARKNLADDDLDRVRRHQLFVQRTWDRVFSAKVLQDPTELKRLYDFYSANVQHDAGFTKAYAANLAWEVRDVSNTSAVFATLPLGTKSKSDPDPRGGARYDMTYVDKDGLSALRATWKAGNAYEYMKSSSLTKLDSKPVQ